MTKAVFIATAEPYSGKSLVLLVNRLLGQARRVGARVLVVPTNEELKIAQNCVEVVG